MRSLSVLLLFLVWICCVCEEEKLVFVPEDGQKFASQQNILEYRAGPVDKDFSEYIKHKHSTQDGRNIFIYDGVFNSSLLLSLKALLTVSHRTWRYSIYESYEGGEKRPGDNVAWINDIDVDKFSKTLTSRILQKLVQETSGTSDQLWAPFKAQGKILRRADFTHVHSNSDEHGKEYTVLIYLNEEWRKNFYGELYLYNDQDEIIAGSVPRFGRIVIWDSSTPYLLRPPSFAVGTGQLLLQVQFSKDLQSVSEHYQRYQDGEVIRQQARKNWFTSPRPGIPNLDPRPNFVSEFSSSTGKKIIVFDGLFERSELDRLRGMIIQNGVYFYDDEEVDDSDNVQWIAGFKVDEYVKGYFWNITRQVIKFASGGQDGWFPYDVSCNLIRSGDHTRIHHDCEAHEDEWTFILYLNPKMVHDDYGETTFYEKNSDNTEIITEVIPKYGRAVVFQGFIPHSARPPSPKFREARLTFVTKVSKNEWTGRMKCLRQESDHWVGLKHSVKILQDIAKTGNGDKYLLKKQVTSRKYPVGKDSDEEDDDEDEDHDRQEDAHDKQEEGQDRQEREHERKEDHEGQEGAHNMQDEDHERQKKDHDRKGMDHEGQERDHEGQERGHEGQESDSDAQEGHDDEIQDEEVDRFLQRIAHEDGSADKNPTKVKILQDELDKKQEEGLALVSQEIFHFF